MPTLCGTVTNVFPLNNKWTHIQCESCSRQCQLLRVWWSKRESKGGITKYCTTVKKEKEFLLFEVRFKNVNLPASAFPITAVDTVSCRTSRCLRSIRFMSRLHSFRRYGCGSEAFACMLLVYVKDWPGVNGQRGSLYTVATNTLLFFFFSSFCPQNIFAQWVRQVK